MKVGIVGNGENKFTELGKLRARYEILPSVVYDRWLTKHYTGIIEEGLSYK